jgi:hypothetical protein
MKFSLIFFVISLAIILNADRSASQSPNDIQVSMNCGDQNGPTQCQPQDLLPIIQTVENVGKKLVHGVKKILGRIF